MKKASKKLAALIISVMMITALLPISASAATLMDSKRYGGTTYSLYNGYYIYYDNGGTYRDDEGITLNKGETGQQRVFPILSVDNYYGTHYDFAPIDYALDLAGNTGVHAYTETNAGIIGGVSYKLGSATRSEIPYGVSQGFVGYPCLAMDFTALKAGTTTVTLKVYADHMVPDADGYRLYYPFLYTCVFDVNVRDTYTLNYDANGGTGAPAAQSWTGAETSHQFTVSSQVPTREGYIFKGWANSADAAGVMYRAGDKITLINNAVGKTLYAVWEQEKQDSVAVSDPILSYVAKDAETASEVTSAPFGGTSFIEIDGKKTEQADSFGGDTYGNTISTAFTAEITPATAMKADEKITWTVALPENGAYLKGNLPEAQTQITEGQTVLADDQAANGGGAVRSIACDNAELDITHKTGTTIAAGSPVIFGIVVDNIYAPGAKATVQLRSDNAESEGIYADSYENYREQMQTID